MIYVRYHAESGISDMSFTARSEEELRRFKRPGYVIAVMEHEVGGCLWFDTHHQKAHPVNTVAENQLYLFDGEDLDFDDFDQNNWVQIDMEEPVQGGRHNFVYPGQTDDHRLMKIYLQNTLFTVSVTWTIEADVRARALAIVDAKAEELRSKQVTLGSAQAMTYLMKANAARNFLAGLNTSAAQKQRLQDEADRAGITIEEAAQLIVQKADEAEELDASIDNIRLSAKKAIQEATTGYGIAVILRNISWPL